MRRPRTKIKNGKKWGQIYFPGMKKGSEPFSPIVRSTHFPHPPFNYTLHPPSVLSIVPSANYMLTVGYRLVSTYVDHFHSLPAEGEGT